MDDKLRAYGKKFEEIKKEKPELTFSQFYVDEVKRLIEERGEHTTIGANLCNASKWQSAGKSTFKQLVDKTDLTPQSRVVDYGCGSLRIGQHFISFLAPRSYMGIDVTDDFITMGLDLLDNSLIDEKKPDFGFVDTDTDIERAIAHDADLLFAHGVHFHIHPDELGRFYSNVSRIVHRPGSFIVLNTQIADEPKRYHNRGWAWPLNSLREGLPGFDLTDIFNRGEVNEKLNMQTCFLRFKRL